MPLARLPGNHWQVIAAAMALIARALMETPTTTGLSTPLRRSKLSATDDSPMTANKV